MMGERQVMQEALFYGFSLERHVPSDHFLRKIDRFVDLSEVRAHLEPYYSEVGRPSIDPELMIRMLIVGYCFGVRSERRLCEEVHLNLGLPLVLPSWARRRRPGSFDVFQESPRPVSRERPSAQAV
jgi:transposase